MNLDNVIARRKGKTVYKDGEKVIKVFDSSYPKSDVLNEALNHARAEETGLNVPKIFSVTEVEGKFAIVTEFVDGKSIAELMKEDKSNLDKYIDMFVDVQLSIHALEKPQLKRLKDKMNAKISNADLDATTRYDLHVRLESMPKHKKLLHGDLDPSNVIIDKDGKPHIIDWVHATQGNASADVARTYLLFCLDGKEDVAQKYLTAFCKKTDTAIQYVQKWLPIVAASQMTKGKETEKEFLARWVQVVEY